MSRRRASIVALVPGACLVSLLACAPPTESGALGVGSAQPGGEGRWSAAPEWPQFRGPDRDGSVAETGLWGDGDPQPVVVWRKPIGEGFAGISIADGRLYTAWVEDGREVLFSLEADDGEERWSYPLDLEFREENGNGPRATPTVDGPLVYALSSRARLHAVERSTGEAVWSIDLRDAVNERQTEQRGYSSSPLVVGDLLVVQLGPSPGKGVVAVDKASGRVRWSTLGGRSALSSPIVVSVDGTSQVVAAFGGGLASLDPRTGAGLWAHPWQTQFDLNIATPLFVPPNRFLISSGYDKGSAMVAVSRGGSGWRVTEEWTNRLFRSHFNSPVHHRGTIYGFDNAILKAISAATGEDLWRARGFGRGSLILVDGRLIVLGDDGDLGIVAATPEGFSELARAEVLTGRSWTPPSYGDGVVYARNHDELVAVALSPPDAQGN